MIASFALIPVLAATLSHAADHLVIVGGPGVLAYNPPTINAEPGDTITFEFHEKNHTVTQSSFPSPCSPLAGADGSSIGFNSGFMPVAAGTTSGFPTFRITVNDTKPIWGFCQQQGPPIHCQQGMVFGINAPPEGNTFEAFQAAAIALNGSTASATATATSSSAWTSPPAPVISTVTETVTVSNSVYTTTYASWEGASPNPTPAATPVVHTVEVGADGLKYTPPTITAALNDIVVFQFHAKNHTVTQSLFNSPCTKVETASNGTMFGFDSGFMPVSVNATDFPTFNITVNTTTPLWAYCQQQSPTPHCQQGMVFGVNPPTSGANTFAAFQQLAMHTNGTGAAGSSPGSGSNSTGTGSPGSGSGNGNGAGRAAVSAGMAVGVLGAVIVALL